MPLHLVQGVHYYRDASSEEKCRGCKIAKDRGIGGPVLSASSYFMKSLPVQYEDFHRS